MDSNCWITNIRQFPVNPVLNVSSYKKSTISAVYIENASVSGTYPKLNGAGGQV